MSADQIKKTKVFKRNFECQIMHKTNAIRTDSVLNQNLVKVYTDGSKPGGRVGAGFYAEYPNNFPKQAVFFSLDTQQILQFYRNMKISNLKLLIPIKNLKEKLFLKRCVHHINW